LQTTYFVRSTNPTRDLERNQCHMCCCHSSPMTAPFQRPAGAEDGHTSAWLDDTVDSGLDNSRTALWTAASDNRCRTWNLLIARTGPTNADTMQRLIATSIMVAVRAATVNLLAGMTGAATVRLLSPRPPIRLASPRSPRERSCGS
jgi:hypothetical protein